MKSFVVFFALVALACAAADVKKEEQRDKRGFLNGYGYGAYPYSSYVAPSYGYSAPAVGYTGALPYAGYAAPAVNYAHSAVLPNYGLGYNNLGYNNLGYRAGHWW